MISILTSSVTLFVASLAAAVLSCAVSIARLVDRKRQRRIPVAREYGSSLDPIACLPSRQPPLMAGIVAERFAHFNDVRHLIETGDGLKFVGRTPWAYTIRVADYGDASHFGVAEVDDDGEVWVVDSCEGEGVARRRLIDDIEEWPGQWYWSPIRREFRAQYDRKAVAAFLDQKCRRQVRYGWAGIVLQVLLHAPILRVIVYATGIATLRWFRERPFCSMFALDAIRESTVDPVPGRDSQLVTPQILSMSMLFDEWVGLQP